jgi:ACS family sodium-dependent inorganic phosphate cotransporter-like MFS transporter 5
MGQNKVAPVQQDTKPDGSTRSTGKAIHFADRKHRGSGDHTFGGSCLGLFQTRVRFLVMVLVLLCLASIWSNILSFNFALICFIKPQDGDPAANSTINTTPDRSATQFNPRQKSYLTAAVAASALIANFIVVQLVNRFGIRSTFTVAGFMSAIATLLLPTAIYSGFYFTLFCRILQGIAFSTNFPAIGAFTGKWTYYKQNGLFVSVLVAYGKHSV